MASEGRAGAASSLAVWAGAAGLALVLLGALVQLGGSDWVGAGRLHLQRLVPAVPGESRIVALGSSKTLTTVRFDHDLLEAAPVADAVRFVRITLGSADYRRLRPALEALEAHPPRLLLVEANLLASGGAADPLVRRLRSQLRIGVEVLLRLPEFRARSDPGPAGAAAGRRYLTGDENYGGDLSAACVQQRLRWQRAEVREAYREAYANRPPEPVPGAAYLPHLRRLRAAGTTVVVLDIPPSPTGLSLQAPAVRHAAARQLRQQVAAEGWLHWIAPGADDALYCDQGHTTPEGQRHFSRWLREQLAPWLAPPHG